MIAYGAALEISRQRRGGGLVSPRQFRVRMVSAAIWLLILTANFYAVTALWPTAVYQANGKLTDASRAEAQLFVKVLGGSFSLVFFALILFFLDMRHTARERQQLELQRQQNLASLARDAAASLRQQKDSATLPVESPDA